MNSNRMLPGFRRIERHDKLLQEQAHDAYKPQLAEPTVCLQCKAVFEHGRWHWGKARAGARKAICPACHRIHDHFPAGYVMLGGAFFKAHRNEVLSLVHNHETRERTEHPLQRIMAVEEEGDEALITTTDIRLARNIGEALLRAYQGELEYHYNPSEDLLRVNWTH
ncbi:MAG: BCAM0308 family protein [Methylophilaceae bacterium]